jgi:pSer/pThr/pTyr-binding forkhead associated (FHA) protein
LVFDDATTFSLDDDYVVGREPYGDARVESGSARPLPLDDASHTVSRVHAEVRLEGWTVHVVDRGSTNGTFVWDEPNRQWRRLGNHPERIRPGTRVSFGRRAATFESPHDHRHT